MYDVRFKGFGYNKQLQIMHLVNIKKFRVMVMSNAMFLA